MTPTPPPTYQFNATEVITDFVKNAKLAAESITEKQLAEAIRQAIASGDFMRCVTQDGKGQNVTYVPFRELERVKDENANLRRSIHAAHGLLSPLGNQINPSVLAIREALDILRRA